EGDRQIPELPKQLSKASEKLGDLTELAAAEPEQKFRTLASAPAVRELRETLAKGAARVSALATATFGAATQAEIRQTLALLDVARAAKLGKEPFLPLRAHFFHRTQPGLWACIDPRCYKRQPEIGDTWDFGKVFFERRTKC